MIREAESAEAASLASVPRAPSSGADCPLAFASYTKAISGEKLATGSGFDLAVYGNRAFTDEMLRLAARVGEPGGFHGLGKRNVFAAERQARQGRNSFKSYWLESL